MNATAFDLDSFMNATAPEGTTKIEPIPGGEYKAVISKVEPREVSSARGKSIVLDVTFDIMDPTLKDKIGREKASIREGFFLDMAGNKLDMAKGKNVRLNRLRAAVDQNKEGWKPSQLNGATLTVTVGLRPDKNSPDVVYNQITSFGKFA